MGTTNMSNDLGRVLRLLKHLGKLAEHSTMTGALAEGAEDAVEKYNLILIRLEKYGIEVSDLFPPLPPNASLDRVGVAAKLLSGFLEEEPERPSGAPNIVIGSLGHIGDLDKLKDLEKIVKDNLPEWIRGRVNVSQDASEAETVQKPVVATTDASATETVRVGEGAIPMPDFSRTTV